MTDKFIKILDKALEHSVPSGYHGPDSTMTLCGYPVGDILDSPALQDKLYELFYPATVTISKLRTISIEDIRSRW